ncbi:hypothetical protein A0J57_03965 [Sphingobium sp. 22B]|uniref:EthD family reductase n=1 Tax=unclassified Sphingobium TaxID=2611147 RepID=UPI0007802C7D|nr:MULTISPECIES: EthD family reductase [unclassified Sphingobium]KXU33805.1 hypothetical protein AXW74_00515 [Sphingobium sp. AM]KYC33750.1 hypothetical protein A0J57_03965 [Sphingobium sp. 22B]OAP33488.1 hypothetical protein A8O16_03185 [Sphingobium sp. 20006FA]
MYAIVGIMKRPDHWTAGQFRDWWLNDHAEIARKLPGLRRYTVHPPTDSFDPVTGKFGGEPSHDGLAFLWFDDKQSAEDAFASDEGKHDMTTFGRTGVSLIIFGVGETREMLD